VDVLFVPRDQHRQGHGRTIFERWATKLPATIRKIQLLAVDLDDESPLGFWQKMGFEVEDADFPEQFTGSYMVKRVSDSMPVRREVGAGSSRPCPNGLCQPARADEPQVA
jgi:hypothetical protein